MPDTDSNTNDLPVYDVPDDGPGYILPEVDSNWKSLIYGRLSSTVASLGVLGVGIYALLTQGVEDVGLVLDKVEALLAAAFVAWGGVTAAVSKWRENIRTELLQKLFGDDED